MQVQRRDAADQRAGADGAEEGHVDACGGHGQPLRRKLLDERRDRDDEQKAGRQALQDAPDRKQRPAGGDEAEDGRDDEQRLEAEVERSLAEALRQVAADQRAERIAGVAHSLGHLEPGRAERERVADRLGDDVQAVVMTMFGQSAIITSANVAQYEPSNGRRIATPRCLVRTCQTRPGPTCHAL